MDTNHTSIDTISVDKKKKSFLPKLLIALSSLFSIVGVGLAILPNHYKSARAVSYDDESFTITLSADELNNYTFDNLNGYLFEEDPADSSFSISYNNEYLYSFDNFETSVNYFVIYGMCSVNILAFNSDPLNLGIVNMFVLYDTQETERIYAEYDLYITCVDDSYYVGLKQAIEQDIQANQPYTNNTFLEDIIELLVGGIGVTASGIGNGLSVLVSNIAIQNGAMSPFISLILIFGGIALALALSRWVVNLIGSLGQRNR